MLVFTDLFADIHGVIRSHADIRSRMQLRRVSRMFYAWDKDLIASAHMIPPAPLHVLKCPNISGRILEWMLPENTGWCALVYSLGGAGRLMHVAGGTLIIDLRRPSNVVGESEKIDRIICATDWKVITNWLWTSSSSFSGLWSAILTQHDYIRWGRDVWAYSEYEYDSMIK